MERLVLVSTRKKVLCMSSPTEGTSQDFYNVKQIYLLEKQSIETDKQLFQLVLKDTS